MVWVFLHLGNLGYNLKVIELDGIPARGLPALGLAETSTIGQLANLVVSRVFFRPAFIFSICVARVASGNKSHLFSTTIILSVVISPITNPFQELLTT
jgi:hypothetical protein